jgi:hypothetical protein
MRRNAIPVLGFGLLLCVGTLGPGCSDSSGNGQDGAAPARQDGGSAGGAIGTGGTPGTGGTIGRGGAPGTGGAAGRIGTSGAGGAPGTGGTGNAGGSTGAGGTSGVDGGPRFEASIDAPPTKLDSSADQRLVADLRDVPMPMDTGVDSRELLDTGGTDIAIDKAGSDGEVAAPACVAAGGTCSPSRWSICPAHYEPIGEGTGHLDCTSAGWCCVPAPSSPCSDTGAGNCVVGDTCTGCWGEAPGAPACEAGRICCVDMCD